MLLETLTDETIVYRLVALAVGVGLFVLAHYHFGRWPDLWRFRRAVLPHVAALGNGEYEDLDDRLDAVDVADAVPEKTSLPLQPHEFVGTVDAPPAAVRKALRNEPSVWPNTLASIQYDDVDGRQVWEVGSYAFRPDGFFGVWQTHVRLTPADDGRRTRLWAHRERNAWRRPLQHYNGEGWDAAAGVQRVREWLDASGFECTSAKE